MKDILGREIQIGDIILEVQTNYNWIMAGVVSRFTAKNVFYLWSTDKQTNYIGERFCKPKYIIILPEDDLLRMLEPDGNLEHRYINFNDVLEIKKRLIKEKNLK